MNQSIINKLFAYRPLLAESTRFGYLKEITNTGKFVIQFDNETKVCEAKECTRVWNKKQEGYL